MAETSEGLAVHTGNSESILSSEELGAALHGAAKERDYLVIAENLLNQGAFVDFKISTTPLMEAARRGHADLIELLLSRGADPEILSDVEQMTAYQFALSEGKFMSTQVLGLKPQKMHLLTQKQRDDEISKFNFFWVVNVLIAWRLAPMFSPL